MTTLSVETTDAEPAMTDVCPIDFQDEVLAKVNPWTIGANFKTRPNPRIIKLFKQLGVKVVDLPPSLWAKTGPAYAAPFDMIGRIPSRFYPNRDVQAAVMLHELAHWTGHPRRLNRPSIALLLAALVPNDELPAVRLIEETTAELAGIQLQAMFGVKLTGQYANLCCARLNSYRFGSKIPQEIWDTIIVPKAAEVVEYVKAHSV